ncbi:MAG TPA: hypothetical protein VIS96_07170 [Terrimicrobiaceae bacterium]
METDPLKIDIERVRELSAEIRGRGQMLSRKYADAISLVSELLKVIFSIQGAVGNVPSKEKIETFVTSDKFKNLLESMVNAGPDLKALGEAIQMQSDLFLTIVEGIPNRFEASLCVLSGEIDHRVADIRRQIDGGDSRKDD